MTRRDYNTEELTKMESFPTAEQDSKIQSQVSLLNGLFEGEGDLSSAMLVQLPPSDWNTTATYSHSIDHNIGPVPEFDATAKNVCHFANPNLSSSSSFYGIKKGDSINSLALSKFSFSGFDDKQSQTEISLPQGLITPHQQQVNHWETKERGGEQNKQLSIRDNVHNTASPLKRPTRTAKPTCFAQYHLTDSEEDLNSKLISRKTTLGTSSIISSTPVKKKRAYFRKNKHSKELLDKIAQERLKRKRLKNRELAAKSRKKRKERMDFLESEYDRLKLENKELRAEVESLRSQLEM